MSSQLDGLADAHALPSPASLEIEIEGREAKKRQVVDIRDGSSRVEARYGGQDASGGHGLAALSGTTDPSLLPEADAAVPSMKKKKPPRRATAESPNVCAECKTTDSKLWRRGPDGNLMCNACGLRWRRSVKAKEAPKTSPRKRKSNASSISPQNAAAMSLPQSSMMAARNGGMMHNAFAHNPPFYGAMPGPTQNFGQLQYQPQNMFLHDGQMQSHGSYRPQAQATVQDPGVKSQDSQIDPALMSDQMGLHAQGTRVNPNLQGDPMHPSPSTHAQHGTHYPSGTVPTASNHGGSHAQFANGGQGDDLAKTNLVDASDSLRHDQLSKGHEGDPGDTQHLNGDASHADDFAGLLSLKAFVDDSARSF